MSDLVAVEAFDLSTISVLLLLLGTTLRDVTKLITIAALWNATINRLTSIQETLQVLLGSLGPELFLLGTSVTRWLAIGNGVLLIQITLEIHVGKGDCQILLKSDEVNLQILGAESLLQINVSDIRRSLNVLLNSILHVIKVALSGSINKLSPSSLSRNISDTGTVDLSGILAVDSRMA
jgi:hypothetical protein